MLRPTLSKALAWTLLVLLQAPWQAHAAVANLDISTVPLEVSATAKPNIIFGLDDSGSMDFEVLLSTNDGAAWWQKPSSGTSSFTDGSGTLWFNANGNSGVDGSNTWYKYAYLFPDGGGPDARISTDVTYDHFAIAPIPAYAYFRSYQYNPIYYNPYTTYLPWATGYISGASPSPTVTFAAAPPAAARSHPYFSGTTINLTVNLSSAATNWTFRMMPGMVIPGATISGIVGRKSGGSWNNVTTNVTIAASDVYWDVQIPYYPATYYVIDTSCTPGQVTSGVCAIAPDGQKIRRYEIKSTVTTYPSGRTYANELQNFANWFTYYRKRKLMLGGAMGSVLSQVRDVRGGIIKFNASSAVTMYDFNAASDSLNFRQILGTVYTNPARRNPHARRARQYRSRVHAHERGCADPIRLPAQRRVHSH